MYTVYSFTQTEQDLTIIVLLNKCYKDCGEGNLQDILTDQNPFEKIKERFGENNILMMVYVNDRNLDKEKNHNGNLNEEKDHDKNRRSKKIIVLEK